MKDALAKEIDFLLDRLADFERSGDSMTEDGIRDWYGFVLPSASRLRTLRAALTPPVDADTEELRNCTPGPGPT